MGKREYSDIKDWSLSHDMKTESYQPSEREYAGMQSGKTDQYVEKRDRIQTAEASKVKSQDWHGRYE